MEITLVEIGRLYHQLVLVTGAQCRQLLIKGKNIEQVISINDPEGCRKFRSLADNKRRILIMGGDLIGCEFADDLIACSINVHAFAVEGTFLLSCCP